MNISVSTERASKEGHRFHEAWVARSALGLLLSQDSLCGISVEGLSDDMEDGAPESAIEIADATFYFGVRPNFDDAERIEIIQFKFSTNNASSAFTMSGLDKTLRKFSETERFYVEKFGAEGTRSKVRYALITNQPISENLLAALAAIREGRSLKSGHAKNQYDSLLKVVKQKGTSRRIFFERFCIIGGANSVAKLDHSTSGAIADWSASRDALARARLGDLRAMVRGKCGPEGQHDKTIRKTDILAALDLHEPADLLPTPEVFPEFGELVERRTLADFASRLRSSGIWCVEASAGVGKTVFVQSLTSRLTSTDQVVLFDCFGGSNYRSPIDRRHRPDRGLLHIVNVLACRGLCDPLLPGAGDLSRVVQTGIRRFEQAIATLRRSRPDARLIVIIDAADNAGRQASDTNEPSFPKELLEALSYLPPVEGLVVIATTRPERKALAIGRAKCEGYTLQSFTLEETREFIAARRPEATAFQIGALHRRTDGVPRAIGELIAPGTSLARESGVEEKADVDALIAARIARAVTQTEEKGADEPTVRAFLCALSRLPSPAPMDELATAFGMELSEVESLAADLSPLVERSRLGLIFRDEPTETLVRNQYGENLDLLTTTIVNLDLAQDKSVYAARVLPGLLFAMRRNTELATLAFDERFPANLQSDLAKRSIRLNRLRAALGAAADARDYGTCVRLLTALSTLALSDERGDEYLLNHADLVPSLADSESLRRLVEARTSWPGSRYAGLAIAYVISGDLAEAHNYAVSANEWLNWYYNQPDREPFNHDPGPDIEDKAAIAVALLANGRFENLYRFVGHWTPRHGYKLARRLFELCNAGVANPALDKVAPCLDQLAECDEAPPALIAAALAINPGVDDDVTKRLLTRLAASVRERTLDQDWDYGSHRNNDRYDAAILRCAARAAAHGLREAAADILAHLSESRFHFHALLRWFDGGETAPHLLYSAVKAAVEDRSVSLYDVLPQEIAKSVADFPNKRDDDALESYLREIANAATSSQREKVDETRPQLSYETAQRVPDTLKERIRPLAQIAQELSLLFSPTTIQLRSDQIDRFFDRWETVRGSVIRWYSEEDHRRFFDSIFVRLTLETITALGGLDERSGRRFINCITESWWIDIDRKTEAVRQLAIKPQSHALAGELSAITLRSIESEDDVNTRTQMLGSLARALAPASLDEASTIFQRGIVEMDTLGSGDQEFTAALLRFASAAGIEIDPVATQRLANVVDLNNFDADKYPWGLVAKAFATVSGTKYLAQIARWHDRDKAPLEYTLPSAVVSLISAGKLPSLDGMLLLGLCEVLDAWECDWGSIIDCVIGQPNAKTLLSLAVRHAETAHPSGNRRIHKQIVDALAQTPDLVESLTSQLRRIGHRSRTAPENPKKEERSTPFIAQRSEENHVSEMIDQIAANADLFSQIGIEDIVEQCSDAAERRDLTGVVLLEFSKKLPYGDRARFAKAVVDARNIGLHLKRGLLKDLQEAWAKQSPTGLAYFNQLTAPLIQIHIAEIVCSNWEFRFHVDAIVKLTGVDKTDLALTLVTEASAREIRATATSWLALAEMLTVKVMSDAPRIALERILGGGAGRLADENGDGPWRADLDPGDDLDEVLAGLIWFRLGAPEAALRWRAAHVVRDFASAGRWTVIDRLAATYRRRGGGAFQGQKSPFFVLHARQWFLFALARLALDEPDRILMYRDLLESIVTDPDLPHVGFRMAALSALEHCLGSRSDAESMAHLDQLRALSESPYPIRAQDTSPQRHNDPWDRPSDAPHPEPRFYFDYDFQKYDLSGLGRMFGVATWEISDRCTKIVRRWDAECSGTSDFGGRRAVGDSHDSHRGVKDDYHSYGGYLASNALAVLAGELLRKYPMVKLPGHYDRWADWRLRWSVTRTDGLWLADGTDRHPPFVRHQLRDHAADTSPPLADESFLCSLLNLQDEVTGRNLLLASAYWSSPDRVTASVSSCLVPSQSAMIAARALATLPASSRWVPVMEYEDQDWDRFTSDYNPLRPWLVSPSSHDRLDDYDPFGCNTANARTKPSEEIQSAYGLKRVDIWGRRWIKQTGEIAVLSTAWGGATGFGRSEKRDSGKALAIDTEFLKEMLADRNCSLLLSLTLRCYHERSRFDKDGDDAPESFTYSNLVSIAHANGVVKVVSEIPEDKDIVNTLSERTRHSFTARFRAISVLGLLPQ